MTSIRLTPLGPQERLVVGGWVVTGDRTDADEATERIEWLTQSVLTELGTADGGWSVLYVDPADGRLWELTHPHSDAHGGGPPLLTLVDQASARNRYSVTG
jgi:hypothetical protein